MHLVLAIVRSSLQLPMYIPRMKPRKAGVLERQWIVDAHQFHEHVRNDVSQILDIALHIIPWHNLAVHLGSFCPFRRGSEIGLRCGTYSVTSGTLSVDRMSIWIMRLRVVSQPWLWWGDVCNCRSRSRLVFLLYRYAAIAHASINNG